MESLETRDLMAGDVSAQVINGNLIITGDAADNKITITQVSSTSYRIRGQDTTINGRQAATFVVSNNVRISMLGGNDVVTIGTPTGSPTTLKRDLSINMGGGRDTINVYSSRVRNVTLKLGGGADKVNFAGSITVTGVIDADGGAGTDRATQAASTFFSVDPSKPHRLANFEIENTPF